MSEHLSERSVALYRAHQLDGQELLDVSDHIAVCELCAVQLAAEPELDARAAAIAGSLRSCALHPDFEELAAYLDGGLSPKEAKRVEDHTAECVACRRMLRDLRSEVMQPAREVEPRAPQPFPQRRVRPWGLAFAAAACAAAGVILLVNPWHRDQSLRPPLGAGGPKSVPSPSPVTPEAAMTIRDGELSIALLADGSVRGAERLPSAYVSEVRRALQSDRLSVPASLTNLSGDSGVLMGATPPTQLVSLLGPRGTGVETDRPIFRWSPSSSSAVQVSVYDSSYREVARSDWIKTSEWAVAAPLRRGETYSWQLTVRREGTEVTLPVPPAPEARFRVLDAAGVRSLATVRQAASGSHLVLAIEYARLGLLVEAERELATLQNQNPGSRRVAAWIERIRQTAAGKEH